MTVNGPTNQITQRLCPISHNTPHWNRYVHFSVPKWCIVGYGTGPFARLVYSLKYFFVVMRYLKNIIIRKNMLKISSVQQRIGKLTRDVTSYIGHVSLQWHHNERDGVSKHRHLNGLPNCLFRRRSKKTWKLHITGLCEGNPPLIATVPHHGNGCFSSSLISK